MSTLVLDIGGTKTTISLVEKDSKEVKLINSRTIKTKHNPSHAIQEINEAYRSFNSNAKNVSLSLPGKWDKDGYLTESLNLKDWIKFPFIETLKKKKA